MNVHFWEISSFKLNNMISSYTSHQILSSPNHLLTFKMQSESVSIARLIIRKPGTIQGKCKDFYTVHQSGLQTTGIITEPYINERNSQISMILLGNRDQTQRQQETRIGETSKTGYTFQDCKVCNCRWLRFRAPWKLLHILFDGSLCLQSSELYNDSPQQVALAFSPHVYNYA